jgi:lantibiotic modifying enzyme
MRRLDDAPFQTEDLLVGTAGTILALVRLYSVTRDSRYLAEARAAGDRLTRSALPAPEGEAGYYWEVTAPDHTLATAPYLGLLHGAAGIGLAMLELAGATAEDRYFRVAMGAAELLIAQARHRNIDPNEAAACGLESLCDPEALAWPRKLGDKPNVLQATCHGAGGICQFFVRLDRIQPDARYREVARGAAHTVAAQVDRETLSGLCHGLAGSGNTLLDAYQALGSSYFLDIARRCGSKLDRFRDPKRPGQYMMSSQGMVSPDMMLGYAGIGSLMLRLANPESAGEFILR